MAEAFQYVRELADRIGPRPATTDAEADAADYIQDVFRTRGLETERQEFVCPRTYSWAYVAYHLLTIASVAALYWADLWFPIPWIAFAVAVFTAVLMWMDLDTRFGLSGWLPPKGPSQNIIARRVPKARRGESLRRVVVVAHYDSARSSLAFSPAMVKNFGLSFGLMKWCTFLVPVLILLDNLEFMAWGDPYLWYGAILLAAYLVVPLAINIHRELAMSPTDGANDNASGVAAMLGVMEAIVPESLTAQSSTQPIATVGEPVSAGHPKAASAPPDDEQGVMSYSPAEVPEETYTKLPDDFEWAESGRPSRDQESLEFDTVEFEQVGPDRPAPKESTDSWGAVTTDFDGDGIPDTSEAEETDDRQALFGSPEQQAAHTRQDEARRRKGFFGRRKKREQGEDVSGWLGVGDDFDARDEGRKIGSWDQFDDDDDDLGFKGGWAGDDPIGDPDFAANEASRIRKRVTESYDRSVTEKEVWFVATGAEEAGTWGMRAFIEEYADDLRGAFIINIDNIGNGGLYWITREGMARRYRSDRRLTSAARKVSREEEILVKGREYKGLSTDATPALARRLRAMSVMAFDVNGQLPDWHWKTDTSDNVRPENIDNAVKLVSGIIGEL